MEKITKNLFESILTVTQGKVEEGSVDKTHFCATHVEHSLYGQGTCISEQHADPDEEGNIAWYTVQFPTGVLRVNTDNLKIVEGKSHGHSKKMAEEEVKDEEVEIVYEANIEPTSAKSRSHIGNLSNPTVNSVEHSGKQIGLITKQSNGQYYAHHSAAKLAHAQSGTFDNKDKAHQFIRDAHAKAIKNNTLKSDGVQKEEVELEEGRQSQRHPLEGHEYHKKSDEALVHIAKDAHSAAEAMKSHNTDAENKYRDQANDSATVRHYRKTHGMADWYKKKYGHIKEEVVEEEVKDEYARKVDKYLKKKYGKDDSQKKLPQGALFAAARRKARLASNGRMDEALSPAIRMQMALQKAREDRERSERNGEAALAGKFSSGPAKQPMKNPSLVSPKNEEVIVEDNVINKVPKPPFDEPTRKARGTVKDKSGAVHTPMSRTKDIAKKAARKQAGIKEAADINDPLDKIDTSAKRSLSRTAGMVKDLATNAKSKAKEKAKKDTFEAEPELSSQIMKQD